MKWKMSTFLNCCCFFSQQSLMLYGLWWLLYTHFLGGLFCGCSTFSHPCILWVCVGMSRGNVTTKKTFTRKQCFYSNCYSVAHSWHYFPTLIKFHPNHNSNHVGALLQSLSNAHYHHRTSCHHVLSDIIHIYIQYLHAYDTYISDISMTFPKSQFHTSIII